MSEEKLKLKGISEEIDVSNLNTDVNLEILTEGLRISIGPISLILNPCLVDAIWGTKSIKIEKLKKEGE